MDPLIFRGKRSADGSMRTEVRDPAHEFRVANKSMDDMKYEEAARLYVGVADLVPNEHLGRAARFNAGLCYEYADKGDLAIVQYQSEMELDQDMDTRVRFRLSAVLEGKSAWPELRQTLEPIEKRTLAPIDKMTFLVRYGLAQYKTGALDVGESWLKLAVEHWTKNEKITVIKTGVDIAKARFGLAEILDIRFSDQKLRLPLARMERDLKRKTRLFVDAQEAYLEVVRLRKAKFSIASGNAIGRLYEDFYSGMMEAEVPASLSEGDRAVYFAELRKKIRPLLFRAAEVYRTNLELARRAGHAGAWTEKTREAMEKIRTVIEEDLQERPDEIGAEAKPGTR
jgi:hypothetical protein